MKSFIASLKRFLRSDEGPTSVEYAIMLALIFLACIAAVQGIGTNANAKFQLTADGLS